MFRKIGGESPQDIVHLTGTRRRGSVAVRSRLILTFSKLCAGAILLFVAASAFSAPPPATLTLTDARVQAVMAIQNEVTATWMRQPEVIGTAVGLDESGAPALLVYVNRDASMASQVAKSLPPVIRGTNVRVRLTDKFRAHLNSGAGGSPNDHTALQLPPIELGTSGGWRKDLANGYCCGGTLGSLVLIDGAQYILSNYHVFEADIVAGGNGVIAQTGDPIIEPGLPDVDCNATHTLQVASLAKRSSLPDNNVDCSIGQVLPGMVRTDGSILEIGTLTSIPLAPALNQSVKKSGRTTGLTRSSINGLNATIMVEYDNECHGGIAFTKTFTGQILFANDNNSFEDSGDSGSLVVEDVAMRPRPIGLLFAGNTTQSVANPIDEVLSFLGATIVGNPEIPSRIIGVSGDLAFGEVGVGSIPPERTMTITNTGNSDLTITGINYPAGFSGNWPGGPIPPAGSQNVIVRFAPTALTSYGGVVTIVSDQTSGVNTITASGTGVIATRILSISGDLAFGDVLIEGPHPQRTMTITNTGNSIMTVSGIYIPYGFDVNWRSGQIPAGGSQNVIVTFWPSYVGSYGGTLRVSSDKTSGIDTIKVSGTAITNNPTRVIDLFGNLFFGNIPVGQTAQLTMSIFNHGNSPLTVSSITYPPGFSGNWSGGTIDDAQLVTVTFSPESVMNYDGVITVNSDATSGTNTIPVQATGVPFIAGPAIALSGDLAFGTVSVGGSPQRPLFIHNPGHSPLTIGSINYPIGFSGNWLSGTVPAEDAIIVMVTFSPVSGTSYGGSVTVNSNATSGTNTLAISGSGATGRLGNISTRLAVGTGDNEMIAGFIVTGTQPKRVILRAVGPSLSFAGALADPVLELRDAFGNLIASNDNWRSDQEAEIIATGIPPLNELEPAIVATLPANNAAYTASVHGANNGTGIGLVEAYDLNQGVASKLANVSTRGFVQTGDNVLIGGLIVPGQTALRVVLRAIGPSLSVPGALANPILELHDGNGALLALNDNWRSNQETEIIATGIPPSNDLESAIVRILPPGAYSMIVRGVDNSTGVALVEAYGLN